MLEISSTEFTRKFRQYNLEAQREPVAVTNHGKIDGYYISATSYQQLQQAQAAMRKSYTLTSLPDNLYTAIVSAKVEPGYEHLDALLKDDKSLANPQ